MYIYTRLHDIQMHDLRQRILLQIDHTRRKIASAIMVEAGKMTIAFSALYDSEQVGQN